MPNGTMLFCTPLASHCYEGGFPPLVGFSLDGVKKGLVPGGAMLLSSGFEGEGFSTVAAKIEAITSTSVRMRGRGLETRRWKVRGKSLPLVRG